MNYLQRMQDRLDKINRYKEVYLNDIIAFEGNFIEALEGSIDLTTEEELHVVQKIDELLDVLIEYVENYPTLGIKRTLHDSYNPSAKEQVKLSMNRMSTLILQTKISFFCT